MGQTIDRNRSFKFHDECGVFGIAGSDDAAQKVYSGLYAIQHRGQESAGIAVSSGEKIKEYKGLGLVGEVFADNRIFDTLPGRLAIGHNRYSTTGSTLFRNAQPLLINFKRGQLAAAHNGNLVNAASLRREMEKTGSIFSTTTDTEVVMYLIARSQRSTLPEMIVSALGKVRGAYSMLFLTRDAIIAVRDPLGFRPLCLGRKGDEWAVASESCALDIIGFDYIRSVEPGEMVILRDGKAPESFFPFSDAPQAQCIFEFIYFARPDSYVFGIEVEPVRREMGRQLAREHPAPGADIVIAVPDSSNTAALGYSQESGIPFELGLIRNHYIGRTFIQPVQSARDMSTRIKYNPVRHILKGKSVVVVDDSIVRGTTSRKLVGMLRDAGAREIHFRVASPPIAAPCFFGVDTPRKERLIASSKSVDEIADFLTVDSLAYLSLEGMLGISYLTGKGFCTACFDEKYPLEIADAASKDKMGLE